MALTLVISGKALIPINNSIVFWKASNAVVVESKNKVNIAKGYMKTSEKTQSGAYLNLVERCKQQELEIKKWKQRALLAEAAYQAQLNKRHSPSQQPQPHQSRNNRALANEDSSFNNDQFHIGDDIYIPSAVHLAATTSNCNQTYITQMSHAIWGIETLSTRVVKQSSKLTPRKQELLARHYNAFLQDKNYSKEKLNYEKARLSSYLGGVITAARTKYQKIRRRVAH
ncbi:hypothetical protein KQX54_012412 [Cotesia glomerata]|uniref:Uncharacterized protein n=1 Tax=Cotesia glomerata TaxID=32391 RepID=A0AAV7IWI0_COTGL|nr:hypothetical protein KQX54_012412 [Cotesia glomerata]